MNRSISNRAFCEKSVAESVSGLNTSPPACNRILKISISQSPTAIISLGQTKIFYPYYNFDPITDALFVKVFQFLFFLKIN